MKRVLFLFVMFSLTTIMTPVAMATTVLLNPTSQEINTGEGVTIDAQISGLSAELVPTLGAFSIDITYDPSILQFQQFTFTNALGDLASSLETDIFVDNSTLGVVHLDELSLLSNSDLISLQTTDPLTLFSLNFTAISSGSSYLGLANVVLSMGDGTAISEPTEQWSSVNVNSVPEPPALLLLTSALLGLIRFRRPLNKLLF